MNVILSGKCLWSYDSDLAQSRILDYASAHFSGTLPFNRHAGLVNLTADRLIFEAEEQSIIPLSNITELFLGFDENFPRTLVKNFGMFWQPLRIRLLTGEALYLIVDYNMIWTKNQLWFDTIKEMLSA